MTTYNLRTSDDGLGQRLAASSDAAADTRSDYVALEVDGKEFVGWTSVNVTRSMDQICSAFTLTATEPDDMGIRVLTPGMACRVTFGGAPLLTGSIDTVEVAYGAESHEITITGRSKTKDLVDCSAPPDWAGRNLMQCTEMSVRDIIVLLCRPFGIGVVVQGPDVDVSTIVPDIQADHDAASVASVIQDLVDRYAIWLSDTPDGDLALVSDIGTQSANGLSMRPFQSVNVLSGRVKRDESNRYSTYTVRGQAKGTDENFGRAAAQVTATIEDSGVTRYRPLIMSGQTDMTTAVATGQAMKERQSRLASAFEAEYEVAGWKGSAGELWRENRTVQVSDDLLSISQPLLVFAVNYTISDNGTRATLRLILPEAKQRIDTPTIPDTVPDWTVDTSGGANGP